MTSNEKNRSSESWMASRLVKILLLVFLLGPPFLLVVTETILDEQSRNLTSRILEKLRIGSSTNSSSSSSSRASSSSNHTGSSIIESSNVSAADCSCYSRCERDSLRKPSRILDLPPSLSSALAAYEAMHSSCHRSKDLRKAIEFPDPQSPCKYLVFLQDGKFGLGNHLLSLLSAFVYAMLTNRMLLVDTRNHIPDLLCEPFRNSSWLLPPDFPYSRLLRAPMLEDGLKQNFRHGSVVHLMLLSQQTPGEQLFFCPKTQTRLENVLWIGWSSNQYYVPRFFTFPHFWKRMLHLFPDVSLVFTHVSRYLFLPQNPAWQRIRRFHSSYLSSDSENTVGVQIRRRETTEFDKPTYKRTMQCLTENNLLPRVSEGGRPVGPNHQQRNTTKVFVTSLQGRYYEELKKTYITKATVDDSIVQILTMSHDEIESQAFDQILDAFVEIWLLSLSDELVTSSWSTFGYVAQGLGGIRPYILNIKGDFASDELPPCSIGQSIEPCNQFPFDSVCKRNESDDSEHREWIRTHLRACQDEPGGLQLVQP